MPNWLHRAIRPMSVSAPAGPPPQFAFLNCGRIAELGPQFNGAFTPTGELRKVRKCPSANCGGHGFPRRATKRLRICGLRHNLDAQP